VRALLITGQPHLHAGNDLEDFLRRRAGSRITHNGVHAALLRVTNPCSGGDRRGHRIGATMLLHCDLCT